MTIEIHKYGVREQQVTHSQADVCMEELGIQGFTVVDSGLSSTTLCDLKDRLDAVQSQQIKEAGGAEGLESLGEANTVRALLAYDECFLRVAQNELVLQICSRTFGEYFILSLQNATMNPPHEKGHHQSAFHRDLPYQHFVSSRPLALNALLCLDDFNAETGGTIFLPGSHRSEVFPSDEYVRKIERSVIAAAGHIIIFDSMLYHRAGINRSSKSRYAINQCYSLPILKQQISLPSLLGGKWSDDLYLARFLGYDSEPPRSVIEWRQRRGQRLGLHQKG